ncbi:MAG: DNA mismatch repair protein MutT, partial [Propionibacteriales bacterium]|nr:DNA mismatch repair protein MutT [Propionibacteriales bacterium]
EVTEETGYEVALDGMLGFHSIHRPPEENWLETGRSYHFLQVIHRAHIIGGALAVERDGTSDDAAWFTRDQVHDLDRVELTDAALALARWS